MRAPPARLEQRSGARARAVARRTSRPSRSGSAGSPSLRSRAHSDPSGRPTNARRSSASPSRAAMRADRRVARRAEPLDDARSARSAQFGVVGRSARPPRAHVAVVPRRASSASVPCPGRGHQRVGVECGGAVVASEPREPGECEHDRVEPRRRRACAAACRRSRAAPRRRGLAARQQLPRAGAGCSCRRARPGAARRARRRRRARRARPRGAGTPAITSDVGQLAGHVLRGVHGEVDLAVASSARLEFASTQRRLSPTPAPRSPAVATVTSSACVPASASGAATQPACASASALPRVPIRSALTARQSPGGPCRTSGATAAREPSLRPAPTSRCRPRSARRPRARTARARPGCARGLRPGAVLQAHGRLVQQTVDDVARDRLDPLEVALGHAFSQRPSFSPSTALTIARPRARSAWIVGHDLERAEPAGRSPGSPPRRSSSARPGLGLADRAIARDDRLEVVDVVERHAVERGARGVDVARHGDVDQQQRSPAAARP